MGGGAARLDDALGDPLVVEVRDLLPEELRGLGALGGAVGRRSRGLLAGGLDLGSR